MYRFYIPPADIIPGKNNHSGQAIIRGAEFRHLSRVLRLSLGEDVLVFDGLGHEYSGQIISLAPGEAMLHLGESTFFSGEASLEVWLVQGLPKGEKMNLIIQKATELGVRGIIPLQTKYSVVKMEAKRTAERLRKWQRVALEAVKQCGRTFLPTITPPTNLADFLAGLPAQHHLFIPWEKGGSSFRAVLAEKEQTEKSIPIYIFIGPEGGFAQEEVALVQSYGGIPLSLGPRLLRTETAGLATIAALMFAWGDWN